MQRKIGQKQDNRRQNPAIIFPTEAFAYFCSQTPPNTQTWTTSLSTNNLTLPTAERPVCA